MNMKTFAKLEELALVALSFCLFLTLDYAWWWFPLLFFVPDVSLAGYLTGWKAGLVMFGHSSFDRVLGFELQQPASKGK